MADTLTDSRRLQSLRRSALGDNNLEIGVSANEIPITYGQRLLCNVYKQIVVDPAFPGVGSGEFPPTSGSPGPKRRPAPLSPVSKNRPFQELPLICVASASIWSVQTLSKPPFWLLSLCDKNFFARLCNGLTFGASESEAHGIGLSVFLA